MTDTRTRTPWGRWAAALVLALAGASLAPAAHAAEVAEIRGTVPVPAGADRTDFWVGAFVDGGSSWSLADSSGVSAEGEFVLDGLVEGTEYLLMLSADDEIYASGYYAGPGERLASDLAGAVLPTAPAEGLVLTPVPALTVTGTLAVPAGLDWSGVGGSLHRAIAVQAVSLSERGLSLGYLGGHALQDLTFTIGGLHPDARYVLRVSDTELSWAPRFEEGYFRAGTHGLVESVEHATVLGRSDTPHVTVGWNRVPPAAAATQGPAVAGKAVVGQTLTARPGTWNPANATLAYQWLRDGAVIPGATSARYALVAQDRSARLAVRVTASKDGFTRGVATSASTAKVAAGAAARALTKPKVSGTARVGAKLKVSAGRWSLPGAKLSYRWLRNGKTIKGATKSTYRAAKADVGKRLSVRVTAKVTGHANASVVTARTKKVAKSKPSVKLTASARAFRPTKATVRVKAAGLSKVTGTVKIRYGTWSVKAKLKGSGKATLTLPALPRGRYTLRVSYTPDSKAKKYVAKASAKKLTLRVR